jgi:hypothetical protein
MRAARARLRGESQPLFFLWPKDGARPLIEIFFVRKGRRASYNGKPLRISESPQLMPVLPNGAV